MSIPRFLAAALSILVSLVSTVSAQQAKQPCPLLGPLYPQPKALQNEQIFQTASSNLSQQLQQIAQTGNSPWGAIPANDTSFVTGVFSLDSQDLLFSYGYQSPGLTLLPEAPKNLDSNTRLGIGSVTKVFTVYTLLSEVGDDCWSSPITNYVPELAQAAANASADPVYNTRWQEVTVGDLASQLGNGPRLSLGEHCANKNPCPREDFFQDFLAAAPVEAAGTTAAYSDDAFQILAWALENMTSKAYPDILKQNILARLNLSQTSWERPPDNVTLAASGMQFAFGAVGQPTPYVTPSGGMFSSVRDLASFGRSILNSTILSPALTRRWLKPHSNTADLHYPVGAPWEVSRTEVNGRVIDLYTKEGDAYSTSTFLVLVPDLNVGFINSATKNVSDPASSDAALTKAVGASGKLINQVVATMLQPIDDIARNQAAAAFVGNYSDGNNTMSLAIDPPVLGFNVTSLSSAGTDLIPVVSGGGPLAMQMTSLRSGSEIAFRAGPAFYTPLPAQNIVPAYGCSWWEGVGKQGDTDLFVFTLGADGKATQVAPRGLPGSVLKRLG